MLRCITLLLGSAVALAMLPGSFPAATPEVKIGDTVAALTFKDIRYLARSLDDLPRGKAYVLVFVNTTCPLVQRYLPVIRRLEQEYRSKGVQFLAVNVSPEDSISAMAAQAIDFECPFPFVKDFDLACARAVGVKRTPEVVVLDAQRRLRYRGRIDDQYRLGGARPAPTRHDLREAIDAVLAGKNPAVSETPVDGCVITPADLPAPEKPITFAEHVVPILRKHCVECHQPNTAAPFSLLNYEQVAGKSATIAEVVREERMPPWFAAPAHSDFVNRRGLSARERRTILQWIKSGKVPGDLSKLPAPPPPPTTEGWQIGKPDLVIQAPRHELPAEGIIDYKYVVLPYLFTSDTWVQRVEIRPDNPRVLHHCNMAYIKLGEKFQMSNFITGTVPGGDVMRLDPGIGFRIPAGSLLLLQVHYVTTGKKENCRIAVGFKYAEGRIDQHLRFQLMVDHRFAIPPGEPAHRVTASRTLPCNAIAVGLFTHMHVRGRDMTFKAHLPTGASETLLVIPNYNFDWQLAYRWEPGKKILPRGTRLEAIAHYDNSPFNPYNPDPKVTVRDGPQTFHEMMNGFFFYLDADEKLGLDIDGKTGKPRKPAR